MRARETGVWGWFLHRVARVAPFSPICPEYCLSGCFQNSDCPSPAPTCVPKGSKTARGLAQTGRLHAKSALGGKSVWTPKKTFCFAADFGFNKAEEKTNNIIKGFTQHTPWEIK